LTRDTLDDFLDELLVLDGDVRHRVAGHRAHQQRRGVVRLEVLAAEHLRLVRVRRQRRQGVEPRHHVEHHAGHVRADLEREAHASPSAVRLRTHLDEARQAAHRLLDRLDQRFLELVGRRLAPGRVDEQFRAPGLGQQLDRQPQQRQHAEQHDDRRRGRDGGRVAQASFRQSHRPPCPPGHVVRFDLDAAEVRRDYARRKKSCRRPAPPSGRAGTTVRRRLARFGPPDKTRRPCGRLGSTRCARSEAP